MSDGVNCYTEVVRDLLVASLAELLSLVSSFHLWPSGWKGEGFAKSRGRGGPVLGGGLASAGHAGRKPGCLLSCNSFHINQLKSISNLKSYAYSLQLQGKPVLLIMI